MGNLKYFIGSFIVTILGLILAFFVGDGIKGLFLVSVLAILEISLSFDNTVVNATVLQNMSKIWRKRFLTWGILIAVFGMRIVFPIIIVSIVARINPISAVKMSMYDPISYAHYMEKAHTSLMSFGGSFLLMVGLSFFINEDKDIHWLEPLEKVATLLSKIKFISAIITIALFCTIGFTKINHTDLKTFLLSSIAGLIVFLLIEKLANIMEKKEEEKQAQAKTLKATTAIAKGGFAMFIYLEILDSSFSFDGVIGAFAITTNLFIIAIGLAIGALFVRSMTIMLVEKNTLSEYKYLEHGAFYAIVSLAIIMFLKTFTEIQEVITGSIGAFFIVISFIHSLAHKKKTNKK